MKFLKQLWASLRRPQVTFANIGEGSHYEGKKSYLPDSAPATNVRYLMFKIGSDGDHCVVTGAGDTPLGVSADQVDPNNLDVPISIHLFGAGSTTFRVVTDGTISNGSYVGTGANGYATAITTGQLGVGRAIIGSDQSTASGDVIEIVGNLPSKLSF